ncbi:ComF family protein [Streptomyces sp. NPDC054855]
MPSHVSTRGGISHLDEVISRVRDFSDQWARGVLTKTRASQAGDRRGQIVTDLFVASPAVRGKRILLFDDTFTTGGTMGSAAHALKQQGAISVIGLTLGRQLRADWSNSRDFVAELSGRPLEVDHCVVHRRNRDDPFDLFFQQFG